VDRRHPPAISSRTSLISDWQRAKIHLSMTFVDLTAWGCNLAQEESERVQPREHNTRDDLANAFFSETKIVATDHWGIYKEESMIGTVRGGWLVAIWITYRVASAPYLSRIKLGSG
jgi:hypothetical protein